MNKYKYILFDMDGTIADTDRMLIESMHILYDLYRDGKYTSEEEIAYFSGPPIEGTLKKEFPHLDEKFIFDEFVRVSSSLYSKVVTSYPNCREVLLELKKHGIKLGVVTNKYHKPALLCLDVIHLEDVFDVVIGYDDVSICKPHGEGILKALKILKANDLKSALYVGDNKIDLDTANNAGIDCALVTWGPRKIDESLKPAFKVKDYLQLRRILLDE